MHDRNGTALKVGDKVLIEAVIASAYAGEDYCNVTLAFGQGAEHGPKNIHSTVTLNAAQTLLLEKA